MPCLLKMKKNLTTLTNEPSSQDQRELKDELRRGLEKGLEEVEGQSLCLDLRHQRRIGLELGVHEQKRKEKSKIPKIILFIWFNVITV